MANYSKYNMRVVLGITKALSDRNRLRILMALHGGELCVCQIIELLGLAPSTVSKHMSILWHAGLVESRKDGRWMNYRLAGKNASRVIKEAIDWVQLSLLTSPEIKRDIKRLKTILKINKEVLCKKQQKN